VGVLLETFFYLQLSLGSSLWWRFMPSDFTVEFFYLHGGKWHFLFHAGHLWAFY